MAKRRTTYGKLERDRAKKAKAAAKRERRQERTQAADEEVAEESPTPPGPTLPEEEVLDRLARIHEQFDEGQLTFDQFEEAKASLLEHLDVG